MTSSLAVLMHAALLQIAQIAQIAQLAQTESPDLGSLSEAINTSELGPWDYGRAAIILVASIVLGRAARFVIKRVLSRTRTDDFLGDLIGRIVSYLVVAFGFVYALEALDIAVAPVLGALGIVGIALAFALQDILENFVAGVILQLRRPFTAGDEIASEDHEGRVIAIDARTVTIRTPDGEIVQLPSSAVIKNAIVNHTQNGRRRTTLMVGVAYGTDLDHATRVAREAATSADGVLETPGVQVYVEGFGDSSVDLAVRFWHPPSMAAAWSVRDDVARAVARGFAANDIEIPFPQRVVHMPAAARPAAPEASTEGADGPNPDE